MIFCAAEEEIGTPEFPEESDVDMEKAEDSDEEYERTLAEHGHLFQDEGETEG